MQDNFDFASNSALEDLSSELYKQKKQGKAFKIAFFTLFTIGIVVVVWQVNKKRSTAKLDTAATAMRGM